MTSFPPQQLPTWLKKELVCPRDHTRLSFGHDEIVCGQGHEYGYVEGVPILLVSDVPQTHGEASETLKFAYSQNAADRLGIAATADSVNPHVQKLVASTCGHLYRPLIGNLRRYPIPELRLPDGQGKTFLDVGCSWGRWTIAAAKKNYRSVGIDPSLGAVLVALQVARQLGLDCQYIVADGRYLPFRSQSFAVVFSYSVIQHFGKEDAYRAFADIGRVLTMSGRTLVQMPNIYGIRSLYHLARRGFRTATGFEVRYWRPAELDAAFRDKIGVPEITVDGFFGLGIQQSDLDLLPPLYRAIVKLSEKLRFLSRRVSFVKNFADSLFVEVKR